MSSWVYRWFLTPKSPPYVIDSLFVRGAGGKYFVVERSMSVADIVRTVAMKSGLAPADFRLYYAGRMLCETRSSFRDLGNNCTVEMRCPMRGGSRAATIDEVEEPIPIQESCEFRQLLCSDISSAFQFLNGEEFGFPDEVLEVFVVDESLGRVEVPAGLRELERCLGGQLTTSYYPPAAIRAALPCQAEFFDYGPSKFGDYGVTAKRRIPEGTIFCYEGFCQRREDVNIYTLAVPAVSNWGGSEPRVAYVDGSPSETSLLGGLCV